MRFDPNNFLHSLAKFIVAQAGLMTPAVTIVYAPTNGDKAGLFYNKALEDSALDPYTVLKTYPGEPLEWGNRSDALSLQVGSIGTSDAAALAQTQVVFECFTDFTGYPLRMKTFPGYLASNNGADGTWQIIGAMPLQRPGQLYRDERGRAFMGFNIDLRAMKIA